MDSELSDPMTFVMDDCTELHSRENNQEDTVSLILTEERVPSGPNRNTNVSRRDAKRAERHSFAC